jgi:maltokinase
MTLEQSLQSWLPAQRWYPGGSISGSVTVVADTVLAAGDPVMDQPELRHLIVEVSSAGRAARYQVLAGFREQVPDRLAHAVIGMDERGLTAYDGLHDSELTPVLLDGIAAQRTAGPLVFAREPGADIDTSARSMVLTAEQSNTSLVFGESAILKVIRRVFPGPNPDLEIVTALARLGSADIATPYGSVTTELDGEPVLLAVLSEYLRGGTDGWVLAQTSVRDLYASGSHLAAEAGGDFAGESERLGAATARVHADLARAFGTAALTGEQRAGLTARMHAKLAEATAEVPELGSYADKVAAAYTALAESREPVALQRIHGDFHLGQVMRTEHGWVILDFEGEPAVPLDRRRALAPAVQDVAGMLRSFDYAARHQLQGHADEARLSGTALEWVARNQAAFCAGYAEAGGADPRGTAVLLRALILDKAVYEVTYEARHRPAWLTIPLNAIAGL